MEQHKNFGRVWAVPRLCGFYPGICLTTEEKVRKNLSQGSRRVADGTMKIHKHTIRIHRQGNKNTVYRGFWWENLRKETNTGQT